MVEQKYVFKRTDDKLIERVVDDENVNINHMMLPKGQALPEHYSNSNVYLIVVSGTITLELDEQDEHIYPAGSILSIPHNTRMNVFNQHEGMLEFFVIKAPNPRNYKQKI